MVLDDHQQRGLTSRAIRRLGVFQCVAPVSGNRGPVSVCDGYHFAYADGRPYVECGTTCYAWAFQPEATQRQTIETLSASPFNKLRMCMFPKWYQHNRKEPALYPFPRNGEVNDYSTFNVAYFQHFDHLILELGRIGVQADLILFHPYDKWSYQSMPAEVDDRYLRLPEGKTYTAEYIDTLELTRAPLPGEYSGKAEVKLPGKPWGSLWFREKDLT